MMQFSKYSIWGKGLNGDLVATILLNSMIQECKLWGKGYGVKGKIETLLQQYLVN